MEAKAAVTGIKNMHHGVLAGLLRKEIVGQRNCIQLPVLNVESHVKCLLNHPVPNPYFAGTVLTRKNRVKSGMSDLKNGIMAKGISTIQGAISGAQGRAVLMPQRNNSCK